MKHDTINLGRLDWEPLDVGTTTTGNDDNKIPK